MTESTIDSILNFIMPVAVFLFLGWIIYRIPIVQQGVDAFRDWNENRRNRVSGEQETVTLKSISYE